MMVNTLTYPHIVFDEHRTALLAGTTMKVVELVQAHQAHGWSPHELHFQHPYLTLGQIHSALAYYWDHKSALDKEIARRLKEVKRLEEQHPTTHPLLAKLKANTCVQNQ